MNLAFISGIGGPELLIIFSIVFLLFGAKKLPEFAKAFGQTVREIRNIGKEIVDE